MADKLKPGISVRTTFVDGETPRAAKLNSLSAQLQAASQKLEAAIGDLYGESYPYSTLSSAKLSLEYGRAAGASGALTDTVTRSLDIVSLGRLVGPASNLNPHEIGLQEITEDVPVGVHEFSTQFPPVDSTALSFSDTGVFVASEAQVEDLDTAGDYHVTSTGKVYTVTETAGGTVTYEYNPAAHAGGSSYQDASFNVIPDLNQLEAGNGCMIGALDGENRRAIVLPLASYHHYNVDGTTIVLSAADPLYDQQLYLPKILVDNWSLEEEIPAGFLYLKNYTKNIIYKNATYYYNDSTSVLIGGYDITEDVDDGDVFGIITVGTDITTSIDDLRRKSRHNHDRSFGEPLIPVDALTGILSAAGNSGVFVPSEIPGNFAPQYLHRDGYDNSLDRSMNDCNVMRGDLALGAAGGAAGTYRSLSGESFKLRFLGKGSGNNNALTSTIGKDADGNLELEAGTNYDIEAKSTLLFEEGVRGSNDAINHVTSAKPAFFLFSNKTAIASHIVIELDTAYGLDSTIIPYAMQIFVCDDSDTDKIWSSGTGGSLYDFDYVLYGPDSASTPWQIDIHLNGSAWNSSGTDYLVRIALWYNV